MESNLSKIPRIFRVSEIAISDYGRITLQPWEMISLQITPGRECDITATPWGFYLGGSVNGRMKNHNLRVAIVRNPQGKLFVNAVESDKLSAFQEYIAVQGSLVIQWLE